MSTEEFLSTNDMTMEQVEELLVDIERNYGEFFAAARDGFYISTREGQFLDCNDALVNMLGYRVIEEVLCLDLNKDLWANPWDRIHFQAIIEGRGYVKDYRAVFKRRDGSPLYVALSSQVWTDERGTIRGYRGFVVDHSRERLMCAQLAETETKFRDLFDNIGEGVFISDGEGNVTDCNQALCDMVGYTRDEFLGMNYYRDLFVNADDVMDFRREFTRQGHMSDYELQIRRKDGTVRDVSMSRYATKNPVGETLSYQGMMRDVTEAKRLRRQLMQSSKLSAMGKMASQLAHELNNPIYGIMNCLDLLKDVVPANHKKRKYLDLAYNECTRTSGLLIKMLKFFKPDDEQKSLTDINKLLEETLLFYERQFKNLNISVSTDLAPDLPSIMGVGSHLKQVFVNMIINANTAMPSGGDLVVTSRFLPERNSVVVAIEDTGVGIPSANLDRIFDAFFTTKKEVKGVGLGLSICFGLIKEHDGSIEVESEEGKGTKFSIHLPVNSIDGSSEQEQRLFA